MQSQLAASHLEHGWLPSHRTFPGKREHNVSCVTIVDLHLTLTDRTRVTRSSRSFPWGHGHSGAKVLASLDRRYLRDAGYRHLVMTRMGRVSRTSRMVAFVESLSEVDDNQTKYRNIKSIQNDVVGMDAADAGNKRWRCGCRSVDPAYWRCRRRPIMAECRR